MSYRLWMRDEADVERRFDLRYLICELYFLIRDDSG